MGCAMASATQTGTRIRVIQLLTTCVIIGVLGISAVAGSAIAAPASSSRYSWSFSCSISDLRAATIPAGSWQWLDNGTVISTHLTSSCGPAKTLSKTFSGKGTRPALANGVIVALILCGSANATKSFPVGGPFNVTLSQSCHGAGGFGSFSESLTLKG